MQTTKEQIFDLLPDEGNLNIYKQITEFETCKYLDYLVKSIKEKYNEKVKVNSHYTINADYFIYHLFIDDKEVITFNQTLLTGLPKLGSIKKFGYNLFNPVYDFKDFEKKQIINLIKSNKFQKLINDVLFLSQQKEILSELRTEKCVNNI